MKLRQHPVLASLATLGLVALPAWVGAATTPVVEFYHPSLNHYFTTASSAEAAGIDQGAAGAGWVRTGKSFAAYASAAEAPAGALPVCRFYGTPGKGPNSHFYTANAAECEGVKADPGWTYEGLAFYVAVPTGGQCGSGTEPVYRNYNQRWQQNDSNHRYTTDQAVYNQMTAAGWSAEGVVFCAASSGSTPPPPPSSGSDCLPAYTAGDLRRFSVSATGMSGTVASPQTERVGANTTFDGQTVVPSTWSDDSGKSVQTLYQQFTATEHIELGVDGYDPATGARNSSVRYAPYLHFPRSMSVGQTVNSSFVTYNDLTGGKYADNTLAFTYNGRETVTVPAGTFVNACKFTSVTQTSAYGITVTGNSVQWFDPRIGLVKSQSNTTSFGVTATTAFELLNANVGGVATP